MIKPYTHLYLNNLKNSMPNNTLQSDIQEINLSYLMLAQKLLHQDFSAGITKLGINQDVATILLRMSPSQLIKLSSCSSIICSFRLNDYQILNALTSNSLDGILQQAHTEILMTQSSLEPSQAKSDEPHKKTDK